MATFKIDAAHSEITFKVKHLMISTVTGHFKKFDATVESDKEDFSDAKITFEADVDSIDTKDAGRDTHLKSDDFFNAEKFPKIKFVSTAVKKQSDNELRVDGEMTIRGISKPVELNVEYNGTVTDPWGQVKAGFEINGKVNRKDFELKWNALTEAGGLVVGDDVKLHLNVELTKQA
jgi:polyisoprenoid-binding protein YceI